MKKKKKGKKKLVIQPTKTKKIKPQHIVETVDACGTMLDSDWRLRERLDEKFKEGYILVSALPYYSSRSGHTTLLKIQYIYRKK